MAKQKIFRTGNSLAVTIPADFVQSVGVKAGQEVRVQIEPETGRVTYTFSGTKQLALGNHFIAKSRRSVSKRKK